MAHKKKRGHQCLSTIVPKQLAFRNSISIVMWQSLIIYLCKVLSWEAITFCSDSQNYSFILYWYIFWWNYQFVFILLLGMGGCFCMLFVLLLSVQLLHIPMPLSKLDDWIDFSPAQLQYKKNCFNRFFSTVGMLELLRRNSSLRRNFCLPSF